MARSITTTIHIHLPRTFCFSSQPHLSTIRLGLVVLTYPSMPSNSAPAFWLWCTPCPDSHMRRYHLDVTPDIPAPDRIRASVMDECGMWRYSKPRLSQNHCLYIDHSYLYQSLCSPRHHLSRRRLFLLHSGHLIFYSSTEIFLPWAASDDKSSICSTATMCQHIHSFPVVWNVHVRYKCKRDPVPLAIHTLGGHIPAVPTQGPDLVTFPVDARFVVCCGLL